LRKPNSKKKLSKKGKKKDDKEKDKFIPPSYFDLRPFNESLQELAAVNAEERTRFRQTLEQSMKKVVMLFCSENGEMINHRSVDLNELGKILLA
jgi:hypothetical protein